MRGIRCNSLPLVEGSKNHFNHMWWPKVTLRGTESQDRTFPGCFSVLGRLALFCLSLKCPHPTPLQPPTALAKYSSGRPQFGSGVSDIRQAVPWPQEPTCLACAPQVHRHLPPNESTDCVHCGPG